ncbi:MAG: hypothetical protein Q8Q12_10980 [bacterium]|nr:hypothetical protein [bacterium]
MIAAPDWLPPLIRLSDYEGDWRSYLDVLYKLFEEDFVNSTPEFRGRKLRLKRYPLSKGKEATFWHMISEGRDEASRQPDLNRCERLRWVKAVIENAGDPAVRVWETTRHRERRICLWLEAQEYLVVLAARKGYLLPWTAYTVTRDHRKRKLQTEYEEWQRTQERKG